MESKIQVKNTRDLSYNEHRILNILSIICKADYKLVNSRSNLLKLL